MLDTKNGSIDLDELVNSLLEDKKVRQPVAVADNAQYTEAEELLVEPEATAASEQAACVTDEAAADEAIADVPAEDVSKPRKGLFSWLRHRAEAEEEPLEEEWADWGLKPIGQNRTEELPVRTEISSGRAEKLSAAQEPVVETETEISSGRAEMISDAPESAAEKSLPAVEAATMVMPAVTAAEPVGDVSVATTVMPIAAAEETPANASISDSDVADGMPELLPDQLSMEEMVRVEDMEDAPAYDENDEEDPEVRLQRTRQEKIKDFVLGGDEEEENEPEEEAVIEEDDEEELEDFTGYDTTDAIRLELQYRCRAGLISLLLTVGLEVLLLLLTLLTLRMGQSPITTVGYLTVHTFALVLMAVLNYTAITRGLSGLFMLRANNDTAPAVATLVALCGVIIHFVNMDMALPMFAPLAGLLMVFNTAGRQIKLARIRENFAFVSYQGEKYAAALVEDDKAALELGRRITVEGKVSVAYFRRAAFLSSYLNNAYEEDDGDRYVQYGAPLAFGISLVLSVVLLAVGAYEGFWAWLSSFVFMLCLSAFSLLPAMQLPMRRLCRRMLCRGGFLVGWNAVDAFGRPDALVVDVADLYADECMLLHGIKTFSGMHIDAAILDAASLSIRAGGPLSLIFRRIIENKEELLREVDSLTYEQGMGLSGWVDGRRVLVGNRRLLQNHDVDVPSLDYEARYVKNGRRLVYLSTSGVLSAMFVVSYLPDETIGDALRGLCRSRVTLLVRSNDANVTAESLCDDFGLDEYYVDVLPATAGRVYDRLVADEAADTPAMMASNGHILGTSLVMAACRSLRVHSYLVLLVQIVTALLGLGLCALWAFGDIGSYVLPAVMYMLGAGLLGWLVPIFKR